ncbi:uncharacterized protein BT62DRAFT_1070361 [Guyanagaster necrorhizus]|uniref:Voltage-gated hydrogen channel 1 n=1 Tax=Guyanagaster necrorhizus TaxID=856835 RepID=A0A9P7W621_9AGAR|nr:uncharacterized protein BT62DRAFT_1070361 [Guyanagaster necrorhizus MCA 3950]KAG7452610.1 hypothetical protein BT62DRAFT_1070361 [Guyanagaster necrorhizus MCA 3950]
MPCLATTTMSFSDSDAEQQPLLQAKETLDSWRSKLGQVLEAQLFHKAVITLITIDAACVLVDLGYTLLSTNCTPAGPEGPHWLEVLAHISLVITTFFLVEIPLALWAFGFQYYNPFGQVTHASLHLFDAAIIIITFVLEITLKGKEKELGALLIVLRLWRLVKLVGGITVGAGEISEEHDQDLLDTRQQLKSLKSELEIARRENKDLRARLGWNVQGPESAEL